MTADVQAVLDRAAELIERDGWCQHISKNREGKRCILGALDDAEPNAEKRHPAFRALASRVDRGFISDWNDAQGRTVDEVLAVLRGAR